MWSVLCLCQYIFLPTSGSGHCSCIFLGSRCQWNGAICLLRQLVLVNAVSHNYLLEKDQHQLIILLNRYFGRRTIYVIGMAAMAIELCLIGVLNVWTDKPAVAWTQAILTLVWTFTFQLSAGQLGVFSYSTTNLKIKSI